MKKYNAFFAIPYFLWLVFFVLAPVILIVGYSFFDSNGNFTLQNYATYFASGKYLAMTFNSVLYAFLITLLTLVISYPTAYFLTKLKHRDLWLLLIILPTWINMLPHQILFTDVGFMIVAMYIQLPFMIMPIFTGLEELNPSLIKASRDLGANAFQTFAKVVFPLSLAGVKSGIQAVFIPSLSFFMLTRLIGGNRVITLGTAIEEHFLVTQDWGMGATIGVVLIVAMFIVMIITGEKKKGGRN